MCNNTRTADIPDIRQAFPRLYLYVHFPSDVLGGMAAGLLCGMLGARLARRKA